MNRSVEIPTYPSYVDDVFVFVRKNAKFKFFSRIYSQKMRCRNIFLFFSMFALNLFCWFYSIVFCAIYPQTSPGWMNGILIGAATDWGLFSFCLPLIKSLLRAIGRKYKKLGFLVYIEYLLVISNFL